MLLSVAITAQNEIIIESSNLDSTHLVIDSGNLTVNGQINANNGLILKPNANITSPGSIKFENGEFLGYDGTQWVSLSRPMEKAILGASTLVTDGSINITENGITLTGLAAANAICRADYPNEPTAHFYHLDEIEKAVAFGNLGNLSPSNTSYWTMASVFRVNTSTAFYQENTRNNNCFNFLSNGGNESELGTTVSITQGAPYAGQLVGNQVNLNLGTSCAQNLRIICGK